MPRPRAFTDDDMLDAAERALAQAGPMRVTLERVALELGATPGALSRRFGSKRGLLLALSARAAPRMEATFDGARLMERSPLAALRTAVGTLASFASSPAALAEGLAFLQVDITDEAFRALAQKQMAALRKRAKALLDEAVGARELKAGADTKALARAIEVCYHGALIAWAIEPRGDASDAVEAAVETLLAPYEM